VLPVPSFPAHSFPQLATNLQPATVLAPGKLPRQVATKAPIYERIGRFGTCGARQISDKSFSGGHPLLGSERPLGCQKRL
jgi:hypothetical protein